MVEQIDQIDKIDRSIDRQINRQIDRQTDRMIEQIDQIDKIDQIDYIRLDQIRLEEIDRQIRLDQIRLDRLDQIDKFPSGWVQTTTRTAHEYMGEITIEKRERGEWETQFHAKDGGMDKWMEHDGAISGLAPRFEACCMA